MKKALALIIVIIFSLPLLALPTHATDLPIDPEHIGQQDNTAQDAITARRRVDLFSENAHDVSNAVADQREQARNQARDGLFGEPSEQVDIDVSYETLRAAENARLFNNPAQFGTNSQTEDTSAIPLWVTIATLVATGGVGLSLAIWSKNRRKEKELQK